MIDILKLIYNFANLTILKALAIEIKLILDEGIDGNTKESIA